MHPLQRADKGAIMRRGGERRARFKVLRRGRSCCEAAGEHGVLLSPFWYRWRFRLPPFPEPVSSSSDAACDSQLQFALLNNLKWHHFQQVHVHLRHVDFPSPRPDPNLTFLNQRCSISGPSISIVWLDLSLLLLDSGKQDKVVYTQRLTRKSFCKNQFNYQKSFFFFFAQEKNIMGSIVCLDNRLYALSYWAINQLSKLRDSRLDPRGRTTHLTRLMKALDEELMMKYENYKKGTGLSGSASSPRGFRHRCEVCRR